MNIFLNNFNYTYGSSSVLKSSGKTVPFYCIAAFILPKFYAGMGLYISFYLYIDRILPYLCTVDLFSGIFSILNIFILST